MARETSTMPQRKGMKKTSSIFSIRSKQTHENKHRRLYTTPPLPPFPPLLPLPPSPFPWDGRRQEISEGRRRFKGKKGEIKGEVKGKRGEERRKRDEVPKGERRKGEKISGRGRRLKKWGKGKRERRKSELSEGKEGL